MESSKKRKQDLTRCRVREIGKFVAELMRRNSLILQVCISENVIFDLININENIDIKNLNKNENVSSFNDILYCTNKRELRST